VQQLARVTQETQQDFDKTEQEFESARGSAEQLRPRNGPAIQRQWLPPREVTSGAFVSRECEKVKASSIQVYPRFALVARHARGRFVPTVVDEASRVVTLILLEDMARSMASPAPIGRLFSGEDSDVHHPVRSAS
jgi:hypothetical protein